MTRNLKKVDLGKIKYFIYSSEDKDSISGKFDKEIIDSKTVPGTLPAFLAMEEEKVKVTYHVTDEKSLEEFLQDYIGKADLSDIIRGLINLFKAAKKKSVDINDYILDKDYVFVDPDSKGIYLIYLPLEGEKQEISVRDFIKDIVGIVSYDLNDDLNFFVNVHNYLNDKDFTLEGLSILLDIENSEYSKEEEIASPFKKEVGFPSNMESKVNGVAFQGDSNSLISDDEYGEETTIIDIDEDYKLRASIKRISSGQTMEINKDNFKIGRDITSCDFYIDNNNLVGRLHVAIVKKYGQYYIIDNSSRNGTFVNGQRIRTMVEYSIKNGDEIRLSNETFIFKLY